MLLDLKQILFLMFFIGLFFLASVLDNYNNPSTINNVFF